MVSRAGYTSGATYTSSGECSYLPPPLLIVCAQYVVQRCSQTCAAGAGTCGAPEKRESAWTTAILVLL